MARKVTPAVTTAAASIAAIDMERTLTQLPFWSSLTEHEMETLRRSAFVRHYEKGAFVHSSDTECLGMLFVLSGEIRTYLLSEEGREVTLFRLYPGELCVLSASCVISQITFDTQMTAGMDTEVLIRLSCGPDRVLRLRAWQARDFLPYPLRLPVMFLRQTPTNYR